MNKNSYLLGVLVAMFVLGGCAENKTRIGEGAGFGGILGAAVGGIVGHQSGHGLEGALIGGAAGAAGGAMVGSQIEKPASGSTASTEATEKLTMSGIVELSKQGVSSDEIISKIKASNTKFTLTADDTAYLSREGVSQRVIEAMQGV